MADDVIDRCPRPRFEPGGWAHGYKPDTRIKTHVSPESFFCLRRMEKEAALVEKGHDPEIARILAQDASLDGFHEQPWFSESSAEWLRDAFCDGEEVPPVEIEVDADTGEVIGHEGRHRSWVADRLGMDTLPAVIWVKAEHGRGFPTSYPVDRLSDEQRRHVLDTVAGCQGPDPFDDDAHADF